MENILPILRQTMESTSSSSVGMRKLDVPVTVRTVSARGNWGIYAFFLHFLSFSFFLLYLRQIILLQIIICV